MRLIFLDTFSSGFWPRFGTETALVAFDNDLCWELVRASVFLLVLLNLSAAFDNINHGILWEHLVAMGIGSILLWNFLESALSGVCASCLCI